MNLYLILLALLTSAINTTPSFLSSGIDPNTPLPSSSLNVAYRCASSAKLDPGRQTPSALDCLNVLTFILATTPNHDRPTQWSRNPASGHIMLPYRRSSASCQLLVRLTTTVAPAPTIETATFDQVIGASMRIVEVCLLNSRPDTEHWGGAALAGLSSYLDVVVWGAPEPGGDEAILSNETVSLNNGSGAWVTGVSQA